jgi:hypothetical protein
MHALAHAWALACLRVRFVDVFVRVPARVSLCLRFHKHVNILACECALHATLGQVYVRTLGDR